MKNWSPLVPNPINFPLLALELGVVMPPNGADAGPVTQLMTWCKANGRFRAMMSDAPDLLREAGIAPTIDRPVDGTCPDKDAFGCHGDALRLDRGRVLRTEIPRWKYRKKRTPKAASTE